HGRSSPSRWIRERDRCPGGPWRRITQKEQKGRRLAVAPGLVARNFYPGIQGARPCPGNGQGGVFGNLAGKRCVLGCLPYTEPCAEVVWRALHVGCLPLVLCGLLRVGGRQEDVRVSFGKFGLPEPRSVAGCGGWRNLDAAG